MNKMRLKSIAMFAFFAITSTNIYAGAFTWSGGDGTTAPLWRVFFSSIILPVGQPEDGDQIAVVDVDNGNRIVGLYKVKAIDLGTGKGATLVFSTLQKGEGYVPGNIYSFQYWDANKKKTYTNCTIEIIDFGKYNEIFFPDDDAKQSAFNLVFSKNKI